MFHSFCYENSKGVGYEIMANLQQVDADSYDDLRELYRRYVFEIKRLEEDVKPHETEADLQSVFGRTDYFILNDEGKIVGFVLLGQYPNSFSRHDIFIGEFYVIPEYRRHGHGLAAVNSLIDLYPEYDISMFILKKNFGAKLFWNKALSMRGYVERTSVGSVKAKTKNCEWFYWSEA